MWFDLPHSEYGDSEKAADHMRLCMRLATVVLVHSMQRIVRCGHRGVIGMKTTDGSQDVRQPYRINSALLMCGWHSPGWQTDWGMSSPVCACVASQYPVMMSCYGRTGRSRLGVWTIQTCF